MSYEDKFIENPNYNGITLKKLLETSMEDLPFMQAKGIKEKGNETISDWDNGSAAFLGPQLWDKTIPCNNDLKVGAASFECMDFDEFLNENDLENDLFRKSSNASQYYNPNEKQNATQDIDKLSPSINASDVSFGSPIAPGCDSMDLSVKQSPKPSMSPEGSCFSPDPSSEYDVCESDDEGIKHEKKPGKNMNVLKRIRSHRSQGTSFNQKFNVKDNRKTSPFYNDSNSITGRDFDPRKRPFSEEELKPQPMVKKSRKQYVPTDLKDDKYWARRRKNNLAAKRSRDARRVKENQIALRAGFLEKENDDLREELEKTRKIMEALKKKLAAYEDMTDKIGDSAIKISERGNRFQ